MKVKKIICQIKKHCPTAQKWLGIIKTILFAWKKGLKTLSYYFHSENASSGKIEMGSKVINIDAQDSHKVEAINQDDITFLNDIQFSSGTTNTEKQAISDLVNSINGKVCSLDDPTCESCQA